MPLDLDETIAAPASPPGSAPRGIIRVSGAAARERVEAIFFPSDESVWRSARLPMQHPGSLRLDGDRLNLPAAVHLWPTTRSYTGEPTAEIHLPGSPALIDRVLTLLYQRGVRPARSGEFTLRAFLNGRLDLVQAEAVLGVIDADTPRQLQSALRQLSGGLSDRLAQLRRDLLELLADLEAGLDFVDEDIEFVSRDEVVRRLSDAHAFVDHLREHTRDRYSGTDRPRIVLAGLPNAGKSTLLNALAGRETALVSPIPGTTRDYLTATVTLGGREIELLDTAGWEDSAEHIMSRAQSLRQQQIHDADLVLWCTPADLPADLIVDNEQQRENCRVLNREFLEIVTKIDLTPVVPGLSVSATTGAGLQTLRDRLTESLEESRTGERRLIGTTSARCHDSLQLVAAALRDALTALDAGHGDEIVALEIRRALDGLGRILGLVYTDDVLDRVFSKFCIGK